MINKLFSVFKKLTAEDFITELLRPTFYENKLNSIIDNNDIDLNWQNDDGQGYLHLCAQNNLGESILWLVKNGINLELVDKNGETAIFYAAKSNNYDAVYELLNSNANLEHKNIFDRTALQESIIANSVNVIDLLLKKTKNLNNIDVNGHNVIFTAVNSGNETLVTKLLKNNNINLNLKDKNGKTILQQKSILNKNYTLMELMDAGADPTIKDKNGKDFLFYIVSQGIDSELIFEKALNFGCDINSKSNNNSTLLMQILYALEKTKGKKRESLSSMVEKFLSYNIDFNAQNNRGETALFLAAKQKHNDILSLLLISGKVDINYKDKNGETVFDKIVLMGFSYLEQIMVLLRYGAKTNSKDNNNKTSIEKLIDAILYLNHNKKISDEKFTNSLIENGEYMLLLKEILSNAKINLNVLNSKGKPLFFDSIFYRNDSLFKLLKDYDLDLNLKDSEKNNILNNLMLDAVKTYSYDERTYLGMLKSMLGLGVDVNGRDKSGGTSVHKAIIDSCEKTLKLLLEESKADTKAVDNNGRNLAHCCVWKGKTRHFALVHSYDNLILNEVDKFGILPINYAAYMGHRNLVIRMIDSGSFINNPNNKDKKC